MISEYDIVFLDYANGVDNIFRNARLLEQVIEWANAQKANVPDAQPNVVLGVSMGGLVSRVALRRMEVEGRSHDTCLYISLDSPHKGANVPPAYQALAWNVNSYLSFVDPSLSRLLYAPAVKQMLKYYPDPANSTFTSTHHNDFMTQYDALGFPATTRNVAITNGSNSGTSLFNPYSVLIDAEHKVGKYKFNITGYSMPNKLKKLVYESNVQWKVSGSFWTWLFGVSTIGVEMKKYYSSTSQIPYDGAPGGYYPLSLFGGLPADFDDYLNFSNFTFIPVASALAVSSNNPFEVIANQNLIGTGRTSFATYYTQVSNQSHTQFTPQNARFILNELAGTNLCIPISGISISGPNIVCSTPVTFTLNNLPAGCTVTWSHSGNLSYISGQGTTGYTVKANSIQQNHPDWVKATVNSSCGEVKLIHSVSLTTPKGDIMLPLVNGYYVSCLGPNETATVSVISQYPSVTSYHWVLYNEEEYDILLGFDQTTDPFTISGNSPQRVLELTEEIPGCPSVTSRKVIPFCGPISRLMVSPNPSGSLITISEEEQRGNQHETPWELHLINQQGVMVLNITIDLPYTINVSGLQPGLYILRAQQGQHVEQHRVLVE